VSMRGFTMTRFVEGEIKEHLVFLRQSHSRLRLYPPTKETVCAFMIDNSRRTCGLVDNHITHNGEDGVKILDRIIDTPVGPQADRIFNRSNVFTTISKNAFDSKVDQCGYFSKRKYRLRRTGVGVQRHAIRINDEGFQDNIWILFNRVHDSKYASAHTGAEDPPMSSQHLHDLEGAIYAGHGGCDWESGLQLPTGIESGSGRKDRRPNNIIG